MIGTTPRVMYRTDTIEPNAWARWFVNRTITKNQNNLISVVGKTGSGKTYSAISICEIMSKMSGVPFTIDNVVFSLTELMDLINSDKLIKGSSIIFDEPQCSIGSRDFQSEANKVFNYLLTTFRHRNLSLFFCTPFESLLDKSTRKLFHVKIETMKINRKNNTCIVKPLYLDYSDYKEEPYRKRLLAVCLKGAMKVNVWAVPKPSSVLIEQYEKKKMEFTNNLNRNISQRLEKFEEKGKSVTKQEVVIQQPSVIVIEPTTREKIMDCLKRGITKPSLILKEVGTSIGNVSEIIKSLKKKQIVINSIENRGNSESTPILLPNTR